MSQFFHYGPIMFGLIHFSSKSSYCTEGSVFKKFTPMVAYCLYEMRVKISKITQKKDLYAYINVDKIEDENKIIYCSVVSYFENIHDDDIMEYICVANWKRTKRINKLFSNMEEIDLTPNRKNFTNINIYSIDPPNCKDIDDALHIYYDEIKDEYEIGIHIADPSSYIEENSELDGELLKRTETIYNYNHRKEPINMIDDILGIKHISLLADGNMKRSMSIIVKIKIYENNFQIMDVKFEKGNIFIEKNLTYDEAKNIINTNSNNDLLLLYKIGELLNREEEYDVHVMIANYMILANNLTAEYLQKYDNNNVLLRSHKIKLTDNRRRYSNINPNLIKKYELCYYEQAKYIVGSENSNHDGLDIKYYTHMTSPLRRYFDILVHRQLWKMMNGEKFSENINQIIIDNINYSKTLYKNTLRYMKILNISKKIGNSEILEATIIYIDDEKNKMRLYIEKYDLEYDLIIKDKRIENIELDIKLYLFKKINVKIISSREPFLKFYFEFL